MTDRLPPSLAHSIVDAIGNTPLLELHRVVQREGLQGRVLAKLEHLQPGLSKKSRIALAMVQGAKGDGSLAPGQTVVELTSGNTGTGLAIVCRALGHPFVAVMSRGNTIERARMMAALGADVVLVDQAPGSIRGEVSGADLALVDQRAQAIVAERNAFRADQFSLRSSAEAHERTTGPELWAQSEGTVDVFVDFVGSGGSYAGIIRYLRSVRPDVQGYVVEPAGAAVLAGQPLTDPGHPIQGGGYGRPHLPLLDGVPVNGYLQVSAEEAVAAARMLAEEEGVFAGYSAGANLAAALQVLRGPHPGATVAMLVCDSGLKYLTTDLFRPLPD
ncbi:MAG TPA: cysteine synthase family protein [Acidimicrobiales bacterium]